jgi:uncharacterized protein YnzC (UPF0291/DUF896 family)
MSTAVKTAELSNTLYRRLKKENPALSEKELRRIDAQLSIQKIEGTVKENALTMSMITEAVNDVRAKRYARKKSCL